MTQDTLLPYGWGLWAAPSEEVHGLQGASSSLLRHPPGGL